MSEKKKKDIPQEQPKPEESTPETPVEETPQVPGGGGDLHRHPAADGAV